MAQSSNIALHESRRHGLLAIGLLSMCVAIDCGGNTLDPAVTAAGGSLGSAGTGGALQSGGGTIGTTAAGAASNSTATATIWDGGAPSSDGKEPRATGSVTGSSGGVANGGARSANGGASSTGGNPSVSAGTSSVTGGQGTGGTRSSLVTVGGSNVGGSSQDSSCADYNAARARSDGLLEACRIASSGSCKGTLQEYLLGQSALTTISLVEGCGTQTVGWDARLGGRLFTFDDNGVLVGFKLWDDIPNGPCRANGTYSYSMGESRTTLIQAAPNCGEDVVCTVALTDAGQLHCPTR